MSRTWIVDGGTKRFLIVVAAIVGVVGLVVTIVGLVYFLKVRSFMQENAANNEFLTGMGAGTSATVTSGADAGEVQRPDPLAAARDGASRWLNGDPASLSPDALATAPTAPQGAAVVDGGEVLTDGDGYSAVSLPLNVNGATASLTVEMAWDGAKWTIISLLVS